MRRSLTVTGVILAVMIWLTGAMARGQNPSETNNDPWELVNMKTDEFIGDYNDLADMGNEPSEVPEYVAIILDGLGCPSS